MKRVILLSTLLSFCGCVSQDEIDAVIYLNNFPPAELCSKNPDLSKYGFYRKLDDGNREFISICKKEAREYFTISKTDFQRLMDKAFPKSENEQ